MLSSGGMAALGNVRRPLSLPVSRGLAAALGPVISRVQRELWFY